MTSCAWLWLYVGAFLMLAELLLPGFVIFFFGLSAATVGLIRFALGESFTLTWQLAAFSAFTILYLAVLRRVLTKIFSGSVERSSIDLDKSALGRTGQVTAEIAPPKTGRVMIGDAEWTAIASAPIAAGVDVKVVGQDNLTMTVEPL